MYYSFLFGFYLLYTFYSVNFYCDYLHLTEINYAAQTLV